MSNLTYRVLERPLRLTNEIRREADFTLENDPEIRAYKRANAKNIERGLRTLAIAEEHGIPTMVGTLRALRFAPKHHTYVEPLRKLIREIEQPNFDAIAARRVWRAQATLADRGMGGLPGMLSLLSRKPLGPMPTLPDVWDEAAYRAIAELADITNFGLVSTRVVTDAGVAFLVDALQGTVEPEVMRYHAIGTTSTAEAQANTALAAELSTVYNPDNTRAQGTLAEGATANIFRTIGTNAVDGSATIVEHGLMTQAATAGGTLWDRSVFGGIALLSGNNLQTQYEATFSAGS
jgi:hypothetical protein